METKKVEKERSAMQLMIEFAEKTKSDTPKNICESPHGMIDLFLAKAIELQANEEREMIIEFGNECLLHPNVDPVYRFNEKYGSDE